MPGEGDEGVLKGSVPAFVESPVGALAWLGKPSAWPASFDYSILRSEATAGPASMNRGDRREPIFKDDADRKRFLDILAGAKRNVKPMSKRPSGSSGRSCECAAGAKRS